MTGTETADLGQVAATGYVAPTMSPTATRVENDPTPVIAVALADAIEIAGGEEVYRRPHERPEDRSERHRAGAISS